MMHDAPATIDSEKISNHSNTNYNTVIITNRTFTNSPSDGNPERFDLKQGEGFVLSLQANPSTGYQWVPSYNNSIINLTSQSFKPYSETVGSSGLDTFHFTGVSSGETTLEMVYKRSWEEKFAESRVFQVKVV